MEGTHAMSVVIRVEHLHLRRGERAVLQDVSLEVAPGEIVALMGASGSGKTTLLRSLAGLEPFEGGRIEVDGIALGPAGDGRVPPAYRRKVGMVFQFHCLFEHLTAVHNVWLAPVHVHGAAVSVAEARALELLDQFGVAHRARALPRELSGGEAQRVAIARALATDPPVLLMDEPTASLDPARRDELATILRRLVGRGRTLVVATHDDAFVQDVASRVVRLSAGRVAAAEGASPVG